MGKTQENIRKYTEAMKHSLLYIFALALTIIVTACNDDVFIEKLTVDELHVELGPDKLSTSISVKGEDWYINSLSFVEDEDYTQHFADDDGTFHIHTIFTDLYVRPMADRIDLELARYEGNSPGQLSFFVRDGYNHCEVSVTLLPTGSFQIEIKEVNYTLTSWTSYPEDNKTEFIMGQEFKQGLTEPKSLSFPPISSLRVDYYFEPWDDTSEFDKMILNSCIKVPVPSYTLFNDPHTDYWGMVGESAALTTTKSLFFTSHGLPRPAAVDLPLGTPLMVSLLCDYEAVGLYCVIKVSTGDGEERDVHCMLRMLTPIKLHVAINTQL